MATYYVQAAAHLGAPLSTEMAAHTVTWLSLWASLPMVVTEGDTLSDLVDAHQLGHVVASGRVEEVAEALIEMLRTPIDRSRFQPVTDSLRWSRVVAPLARYVMAPWSNGERKKATSLTSTPITPLRWLPAKAIASVRERGPRGLMRDIRSYLEWRWTRG